MALDLTECWEMVREWVYLFLQTVKKRLPKSETSQSDPEWKGNIVLHWLLRDYVITSYYVILYFPVKLQV